MNQYKKFNKIILKLIDSKPLEERGIQNSFKHYDGKPLTIIAKSSILDV